MVEIEGAAEMSNEAKGKVIVGDFWTAGDLPVERVRANAEEKCEKLLCIGKDKNGKAFYSSSFSDGAEMLWMIEQFKARLLSGKFGT